MSHPANEALEKPDMQAVLSRTHITFDLHGFLLPVLEAISNAMDGIHELFGDRAKDKGDIRITFKNPTNPATIKIEVSDNGIGLNESNYTNFKTPFTGHKLTQKGRGFGRFIAFKVFDDITYSSRYADFFDQHKERTFRFDLGEKEEIISLSETPTFQDTGLAVSFAKPHKQWHQLIRNLDQALVLDEIGAHFLPYFLYRWLPKITVQFDDEPATNITSHFKNIFVESDKGTIRCEIDGTEETLDYSLTRIEKTRLYKSHCLLFSAADRIVGFPRDLTNKLGAPHFVDEEGKRYIVIAVVRGEAFETRLNDARTNIGVSPKTIEDIVNKISAVIQSRESDQIERIKRDQSTELVDALRDNPILRLGLRGKTVGEYVAHSPNSWRKEEFISDLAIERYRAAQDLDRQIEMAANNPADYGHRIKELVGKVDEGKKEALAEYVIHRKSIISLIESARRYNDDGKIAPEDSIHQLIFRRFGDNTNTRFFEHNLWMIDDTLAFMPYISSDRSNHGRGRKLGDKVTDLLFFDDSMILGDEDGTSLIIVEFKKPGRNDYKFGKNGSDPILQVMETLDKAMADGGIQRDDGSHLSFKTVVKRFAFVIADLTPTLVKVLRSRLPE